MSGNPRPGEVRPLEKASFPGAAPPRGAEQMPRRLFASSPPKDENPGLPRMYYWAPGFVVLFLAEDAAQGSAKGGRPVFIASKKESFTLGSQPRGLRPNTLPSQLHLAFAP